MRMIRPISGGIGIDLVETSRFRPLANDARHPFLLKVFSKREIEYCLGHKDSATHFAGIFAAKEAASKALGTDRHPFIELEVRHTKNGAPEIWMKGKKLQVHISISHVAKIAAAIATT